MCSHTQELVLLLVEFFELYVLLYQFFIQLSVTCHKVTTPS